MDFVQLTVRTDCSWLISFRKKTDYLIIFSAQKTRLLSAHLWVKRGSLMISSSPPRTLTRIARLKGLFPPLPAIVCGGRRTNYNHVFLL